MASFRLPLFVLTLYVLQAVTSAGAAGDPRVFGRLSGSSGTCVSFSSDGKLILTAGGEEARVWDAQTLKPLARPLAHGAKVNTAELSADGTKVLTAGGSQAKLWDARTGKPLLTLNHKANVWAADCSPDGTLVVTACKDRFARVWDARNGNLLLAKEHPREVCACRFDATGRAVLSVSVGQGIEPQITSCRALAFLWNARTGDQLLHSQGVDDRPYLNPRDDPAPGPGRPAVLSPDGKKAAFANDIAPAWASVCDLNSGDPVGSIDLSGEDAFDAFQRDFGPAIALTFSPDGHEVVACCRTGALVWDANAKNKLLCVLADASHVYDAVFSPDGKRLLIASDSYDSGVWDIERGQQILELPPISKSGLNAAQLTTEMARPQEVPAIAFSPDGKRIAAGWATVNETIICRPE